MFLFGLRRVQVRRTCPRDISEKLSHDEPDEEPASRRFSCEKLLGRSGRPEKPRALLTAAAKSF